MSPNLEPQGEERVTILGAKTNKWKSHAIHSQQKLWGGPNAWGSAGNLFSVILTWLSGLQKISPDCKLPLWKIARAKCDCTVRPFSVRQRWINARKNIWVSFRNKEAFNFFFGVKSSTLFFTLKFPYAFAGQFAQSIPSHSRIQHHRAMDHASIDCPTPKDLREFSKKLGCVSPLPYYFWLKSYGSFWVTQIIHPFEENATKIIGTFSDHPKTPFCETRPLVYRLEAMLNV